MEEQLKKDMKPAFKHADKAANEFSGYNEYFYYEDEKDKINSHGVPIEESLEYNLLVKQLSDTYNNLYYFLKK